MSEGIRRHSTLATSAPVRMVRHLTEACVAVLITGYAAIICLQVFYRYALNDSLVWSEEIVRYGLLWGVMLGAALASDRNAHIALEPLKVVLSPSAYHRVTLASGVFIVVFCLITAWFGWEYCSRLWRMTSPASQIPMPYVFLSIPIGCLLISFFTVVHLISGSFANTTDPIEGLLE
jgi:TRAP-type C4-dicarboxylate transport system permease small subunit